MNEPFWISDLHLGHSNLLNGYRGRFFKSKEEHDEVILDNVFNLLKRGDRLYHLGDLAWKYTSEDYKKLFDRFHKARIDLILVEGNHDKVSQWKHKAIKSISQIKEISVEGQSIVMCHYPILVHNRSHYSNVWQLFGHIHHGDKTYETMKSISNIDQILGKKLNVNLEFHDFHPWSFEEIKEEMKNKPDNFDLIKKK